MPSPLSGARAVHIPTFPSEVGLAEYHDERYDPVWSAISETDMSISQHLGLVQSLFELLRRDPTPQKAIFTSQPAMRLAETLGFWILPGVSPRFPDLKIVLVEPSLGWVPYYLDVSDSMAAGPYDFPALDDKPSAYFHRQMYLTFVDDPRGLEHRHELGVDRIMWSTDFPHPATSWPNSQAVVEKNFAGIPDDEPRPHRRRQCRPRVRDLTKVEINAQVELDLTTEVRHISGNADRPRQCHPAPRHPVH